MTTSGAEPLRALGQPALAQVALVDALAETHSLAQSRFEKGIDSYLVVLDAQHSLSAAQQGLVSVRLAQVASQARLYAVLDGGGQACHWPAAGDFCPTNAGAPASKDRGKLAGGSTSPRRPRKTAAPCGRPVAA